MSVSRLHDDVKVDGWRAVSSQRTSEFDTRREMPLTPAHKIAPPELYFTKMLVESS